MPKEMSRQNAAIWYAPEDYATTGSELFGRQAASENFLRAYARAVPDETLYAYTGTKERFQAFGNFAAKASNAPRRCIQVRPGDHRSLSDVGLLYHPGPSLGEFAWKRRRHDQRGYSLCGVFHTTCTEAVMDEIGGYLTAPMQPWDAVICTSTSMKTMVEKTIAANADYLEDRIGARPEVNLQLPAIPLGIDYGAFNLPGRDGARKRMRSQLSIGDDDVAILFLGRLCFGAKANPYPMLIAAQRTAIALAIAGRRVHLIQAGWFPTPEMEKIMRQSAANLAPDVEHHFPDGRKTEIREDIWCASDIFCSLSDNIQETFGLTPVEAMASGLPVVVSDWDGYRDTVRHEVDGFRAATVAPAPGAGGMFALSREVGDISENKFCSGVAQHAGVDIDAVTKQFLTLANDADLRRRMGEAGRKRAKEVYDWPNIIARYQDLWDELCELRRTAPESAAVRPNAAANPAREDPYRIFSAYPSRLIGLDVSISRNEGANDEALEKCLVEPLLGVLPEVRGGPDFMRTLWGMTDEAPKSLGTLNKTLKAPAGRIVRAAGWLSKAGLIELDFDTPAE